MKKKFISLLLAIAMCFGAVFAITACGNTDTPDDPNSDASGDESLFEQLCKGMTDAIASAKGIESTFDFTLKGGNESAVYGDDGYFDVKVTGGAALLLPGAATVQADAYMFGNGVEDGDVMRNAYAVAYLRPDAVYSATSNSSEYGDYDALKAAIKNKSVMLESGILESDGEAMSVLNVVSQLYAGILQYNPAVTQEDEALFKLLGGSVTETETGYVMSFDVPKAIDTVAAFLLDGAKWIEENKDLTIAGLLQNEQVHGYLETALKDKTAEDFFAVLRSAFDAASQLTEGMLPSGTPDYGDNAYAEMPDDDGISDSVTSEETVYVGPDFEALYEMICSVLPEPQENETMLAYLERCVASKELLDNLLQMMEVSNPGLNSIGDVSFAFILENAGVSASELVEYAEALKEWRTLLVGSILPANEPSKVEIAFTISFLFGKDKKLTGIAVDASADLSNGTSDDPVNASITFAAKFTLKNTLTLFDIG